MNFASSGLVHDAIKKDDVSAYGLIERKGGSAKIVVVQRIVETVQLTSNMAPYEFQKLIEGGPGWQPASGLLNVKKIVANVIVPI
jgi:hypothetical protein